MSTFLTLLKTSLNINFGISALKYRFTKEKRKIWEPIGIGISATIGIGVLVAMFTGFLFLVFLTGKSMNQPAIVLTTAFVAAQLFLLIFGIFHVMSSFYFSKDLEFLVPMPLKPSQILGTKFVVVMINEYLIVLPLVLPAIIIFGAGTGQGVLYWLKSLILIFTLPVIPLIIGAIFVIILMRFVNLRSSKDLFVVIGGIFGLLFGLGINFFVQRIPDGAEGEYIKNLIASQSGLIESIGNKFPPSLWATFAISRNDLQGLGYLLLFVGVSAVLFATLLWLGNQVFYKGLLAGQEVTRKRKMVTTNASRSFEKESSVVAALFWKEWKLFIRTPIYALNGLSGMIMGPVLLIMPFISQGSSLKEVFPVINDPRYSVTVTLAFLLVTLFVSSMNIVACTAISREGHSFWISKLIPASPRDQVTAKVLHSMSIAALGIILTNVIIAFMFKLPVLNILVIFVLALLGSLLLNVINLMIDVIRPKLEWTNPQEAVKSNANGFFGIMFNFVAIGVLGLVVFLMFMLHAPGWLAYPLVALIFIGLGIPSLLGLFALADRQYGKIEV